VIIASWAISAPAVGEGIFIWFLKSPKTR